jgi:protoheme IX farnesyltransferase
MFPATGGIFMSRFRFSTYAWTVLFYNLGVILLGALVRATGSGAGCNNHWPDCNGTFLPLTGNLKTLIEFSHRSTSGLAGLLVVGLVVGAFRAHPKGHPARFAALLSLFFTITEALVGRWLVVAGLVEQNATVIRAFAISVHLVNTFLLLAFLTLTAWWSEHSRPIRFRAQGAVGWALAFALAGVLILGISGAITALGDTLFPVHDTLDAIRVSFSSGIHFLKKLRILHPMIAMSVGLYVLLIAGLVSHLRPSADVRRFAQWIAGILTAQIGLGLLNVMLHAPVWMQLVHLLVSDLLWISLILLTASALTEGVRQVEMSGERTNDEQAVIPRANAAEPSAHAGSGTATWKDYLALTKPRVISLLLFTTLAAMFIAARGWPGTELFLAVAVGGYMAAGAANAINMVVDRDIDGRMKRTAKRPTVTQTVSSTRALRFAFALAAGSFALLWAAANLLTAMLALAGLVFYVIVYTMLLKRRTWHNIVIGGAAGAFPPLVGWAAVTNQLGLLSWYLFAIIFMWTPVHFWALALLIKDDYARAGVPMLPVVLGERMTVLQIGLYAVLTAVISVLPMTLGEVGWLYLGAAVLLNLTLLGRSLQLYRQPGRPRAVSLYKYSMLYLALLFLAMAVDRTVHL